MQCLHAKIRTNNIDQSVHFYRDLVGLQLLRQNDYPAGKLSLYYFVSEVGAPEIELTHNWDH